MKRKQKTDIAIAELKKRYPTCLICAYKSEGCHILPRNNPAKYYDSSSIQALIPLCRTHHIEYDSCKTHIARYAFLIGHNLREYALRLESFIGYRIGGKENENRKF